MTAHACAGASPGAPIPPLGASPKSSPISPPGASRGAASPATRRKPSARQIFLVVADESREMHAALRYASLAARRAGGVVALFAAVNPPTMKLLARVEEKSHDEARAALEKRMASLAAVVNALSGAPPVVVLREGETIEELARLLKEEKNLAMLVLASAAGSSPGPIISALAGRLLDGLRAPVTIVPGRLSSRRIDQLIEPESAG